MRFSQPYNLSWNLKERIEEIRNSHRSRHKWFKNCRCIACIDDTAILFVENRDAYLAIILGKSEDPIALKIEGLAKWTRALCEIFPGRKFWIKLICDIYKNILDNEQYIYKDENELIKNLEILFWKYMSNLSSYSMRIITVDKDLKSKLSYNLHIWIIVFGQFLYAARRIRYRKNPPCSPWILREEKMIMYPILDTILSPVMMNPKMSPGKSIKDIVAKYRPKEEKTDVDALSEIDRHMIEAFDIMNAYLKKEYNMELDNRLKLTL